VSKQLTFHPRVRKLLKQGLAHHRAGRLKLAEGYYRRTLTFDPRCPQALHLLGLLAREAGQNQESICLIGQALALDPDDADALGSLAASFLEDGRIESAIPYLRRVAELRPDSVEDLHRVGQAQEKVGDWEEAQAAYRRALALDPSAAELHCSLARLLYKKEAFAEAAETCRRALAAHPHDVDLHNQLGRALTDLRQYDAAREAFQRALALQPDSAQAIDGLGIIFESSGDLAAAAASYQHAAELDEKWTVARIHLGNIYVQRGEWEKAVVCFERVRQLHPDSAEAHSFLGLIHLQQGKLALGWPEYEYRWKTLYGLRQRRKFTPPLWKGEPLRGSRILLHPEQGLGDNLQFVRYVPLVAARGGKVILQVPPRLRRLFASTPGAEQVVSTGEAIPGFDWQCPLLSLPLAFGTELNTIPAAVPYIHADPVQAELWRKRLRGNALRIGLAWGGNAQHPYDRWRSIALELLAPLTKIPGAAFYSLQIGEPAAQIKELGSRVRLVDLQNEQQDFADTAAIVANLDLVISIDSAVAHLAGAMGKPVWILLHKSSDWRWMLDREDSPWYPTARLFRQSTLGNWQDVVASAERELHGAVARTASVRNQQAPGGAAPFPAVIDVIRFLQAQTGTVCRRPQPGDRVGFALSSKDRVDFTSQTLEAMDQDGGYDLIWNDASDEPEARALPKSFQFRNARLVEVNYDVRGGPDRAICFGLNRLLKLGYDYVGLIENDIVMQPGWFGRLMNLFELAADDGIVCGAATVRSYEGRVLEHRWGYSINWGTGAGMILFARPAAEVILRQYPKLQMSTASLERFYTRLFRLNPEMRVPDSEGKWVKQDCFLTLDWGYTPMLYMHGYTSVGSIPSLARDLEFPPGHYLLNDYVQPERHNAGLMLRRSVPNSGEPEP
jgi:tetratricopeptide (TPR) repeat protein